MHILLVEDHDDSRRALSALLRLGGHEVVAVGTAREAAEAGGQATFDCAVIDVGLPDALGTQLVRDLCARGPLKCIALTGNTEPADIDDCLNAGFLMHLPKPVAIDDLSAALKRIQQL